MFRIGLKFLLNQKTENTFNALIYRSFLFNWKPETPFSLFNSIREYKCNMLNINDILFNSNPEILLVTDINQPL